MDIETLAAKLRNYEGVRRKHPISQACAALPIPPKAVLAHFGEDCAVIQSGNSDVLLFACDGIRENLIRRNPWWAGYCSVLVNVNDISAMGGEPVAMVNVVSSGSRKTLSIVMRGMAAAVRKFGVPMVGGHTHPDAGPSAISVSILGKAKLIDVIYSHTSQPGDALVVAMDLDGRFTRGLYYSWDTTSHKKSEDATNGLQAMQEIAKKHLASAAKDISMPGTIGTLGMMLESSDVGGVIDIEAIPTPHGYKEGQKLVQWLRAYQGCGFVLSCKNVNVSKLQAIFNRYNMTSARIGHVTKDKKIIICGGNRRRGAVVFDFKRQGITGISTRKRPGKSRNRVP